MNPSYMAFNKALMTTITNMMKGIEPPAPKKGKKETSINGRAFAPGKGVQQETGPEKEVKVQAHLKQLAAEAKARSVYPYSDLIMLRDEEAAERGIEV